MRGVLRDMATAFFMGMVLPWLVIGFGARLRQEAVPEPTEEMAVLQEPVSSGIALTLRNGEAAVQMELETYLVGVVLAEMPAFFEEEALKAQAVAARTYTAKAMATGGKHGDGSLCADSTCCQAYLSEADYLEKGGTEADLNKIRTAVWSTAGEVLTYENDLIQATYFSCSGGKTEDAAAVWGTDYPYLVSVDSPGEEEAAHFRDTVVLTPEELEAALGRDLEGRVKDWFEMTVYNAAGSVETIRVCGEKYTGTEFRSLLGLRSTAFSIDVSDAGIRITTKGYGHRVGLSQYGADAMAVRGSGYGEILDHYYPGTERKHLKRDSETILTWE